MAVFVLDRRKQPLMPCSEKRARLLLSRHRARVHRLYPFTIRLSDRFVEQSAVQPVRFKLDPGSKVTGGALVRDSAVTTPATGEARHIASVLLLMELQHRGKQISETLTRRRAFRRRRRGQNLRYRQPRFDNRTRSEGWLPPSLQHRVDGTLFWANRLRRLAPVSAISVERVKFDMQKLENPEISGIEYQHGTLRGYELREYILEKWGRKCAYCDEENTPLEMEHIVPTSKGGSDRVANLTLACVSCNREKNHRYIQEFLAHDPERLERILIQAKAPLKDAAAVNATRNALYREMLATGLAIEASTGGLTKFNRCRLGIPKSHCLDAVCVGNVASVEDWRQPVLSIKSTGRGSYQRTRLTRYGFPRGYLMRRKQVQGFQTGDLVKATVPTGKRAGAYTGRVAIRATGSFNIQTPNGVVQGASHRFCRLIQQADGYGYQSIAQSKGEREPALLLPGLKVGVSRART